MIRPRKTAPMIIVLGITALIMGGALRSVHNTTIVVTQQNVEAEVVNEQPIASLNEYQPEPPTEVVEVEIMEKETEPILSKLNLSSTEVLQGETLVIETRGEVQSITVDGRELTLGKVGDKNIAVIGFDTRTDTGERTITYTTRDDIKHEILVVKNKNYPVTKIIIPPKLVEEGVDAGDLVTSIVQTDNITLTEILNVITNKYLFTEPFVEPLDKWSDVGGFGNVREDENGAIRHLGVDLDGSIGDAVYATNRGKVVHAGSLQNYGNVIVIDHGLGIFSLYLHLSKTFPKVGDTTERGETIGEVGNTGAYTLEPHLHFGIKITPNSVNPRDFIDTMNRILE
jgi:hypothetical protein